MSDSSTTLVDVVSQHRRPTTLMKLLDLAAGDGRHTVAIARLLHSDPRVAGLEPGERVDRAVENLHLADSDDAGARSALRRWALAEGATDPSLPELSLGDPLAFDSIPVQGQLFGETYVPKPPGVYREGPFDVVVADIPRREIPAEERSSLRERYESAAGLFSYEAPLAERAIRLARANGVVALRLRSAVLRREFGRHLVDNVLAETEIIDMVPDDDHVILVIRPGGEPTGAALIRAFGSETAARVLRTMRAHSALSLSDSLSGPIGRTSTPGCDEVWEPPDWLLDEVASVVMVRGEDVDSWRITSSREVVWPYDTEGRRLDPPPRNVIEWLSRFRAALEARRYYGQSMDRRGLRWFDYLDHHPDRWRRTPSLVIARNGVSPRCAVVRTPTVVSGTALAATPERAADAELLCGLLNSSVASFWFKHAFHVYETSDGRVFEATATGLRDFPLPADSLEVIRPIAEKLDRLGRSLVGLQTAIEGDPERLDARLDAVEDANRRIAEEISFLRNELDWAVYAAYGLVDEYVADEFSETGDPDGSAERVSEVGEHRRALVADDPCLELLESSDHKHRAIARAEDRNAAFVEWLGRTISKGFAAGSLPADRPVPASDVADWLRSVPLSRAVLAASGAAAEEVLLRSAVPFESDHLFTRSGLEKLRMWAEGVPETFRMEDFAAVQTAFPRQAKTVHQRRVWGLRGRYNVPRERFVHLVELSERMQRPLFGWAGATAEDRHRLADRVSEDADSSQIDLERMLVMRAELDGVSLTSSELADRLWAQGWSYREVRLALDVLEQAGAISQVGGRWKLSRD